MLEDEEREMITGVMRLSDRTARALMTPRHEVEMLPLDATGAEAVAAIRNIARPRMPVVNPAGAVVGIDGVVQGLAAHGDAGAGTLAGGIWEALLTTAVGLCVAVPFAIVHAALENRIERFRARMEDALTRLFTVTLYRAG